MSDGLTRRQRSCVWLVALLVSASTTSAGDEPVSPIGSQVRGNLGAGNRSVDAASITAGPIPAFIQLGEHPHPFIAAPLTELAAGELPDYLADAVIVTRPIGKYTQGPAAGMLDFEVTSDAVVFLAASVYSDGEVRGEMWKEATFQNAGWIPLFETPLFNTALKKREPYLLYRRDCQAGERFRIRTRVRQPSLIIVPSATAAVPTLDALEPDPFSEEWFQQKVVRAKSAALLNDRRFDDLENWAANYIRTDAHYPSGRYKLTDVYSLFTDESQIVGANEFQETDRRLQSRIALLEEWLREKPNSAAARIVLANTCLRYSDFLAWNSRADDAEAFADEFSRRALELIYEAEQFDPPPVEIYTTWMATADRQEWDIELIEEYVDRAIATGKWCPDVLHKLIQILRFGHGSSFDYSDPEIERAERSLLNRVLTKAEARLGPKFGNAIYAAAFMQPFAHHDADVLFLDKYADWPRMKQGFEDLLRCFPNSRTNQEYYCRYACLNGDRETAQKLFVDFGLNALEQKDFIWNLVGHGGAWVGTEEFDSDLAWARADFSSGGQRTLIENPISPVVSLAWIDQGRKLLAGTRGPYVLTCDLAGGKPQMLLKSRVYNPPNLRTTDDGRLALLGSAKHSGRVGVVDVSGARVRGFLEVDKQVAVSVSTPSHRGTIAISGNSLYNLPDPWPNDVDQPLAPAGKLKSFESREIVETAFTADDAQVLAVDVAGHAALCDVATGDATLSWSVHSGRCIAADASPDAAYLATLGDDDELRFWNVSTGKMTAAIPLEGTAAPLLAVSPTGRWVAAVVMPKQVKRRRTGESPQDISLFDMRTGRRQIVYTGHKARIVALAFSPDGRTLASSSLDRSLRLWDVPQD